MAQVFEVSQAIVSRIINDLTDRRGLRQTFESFDLDIQLEIQETWEKIVTEELQKRNLI